MHQIAVIKAVKKSYTFVRDIDLSTELLFFLMMYNTMMESKVDGLAVREHFLSKNAYKSPILGDTILDQLTSERASTHNFKDYDLFHGFFEKYGT